MVADEMPADRHGKPRAVAVLGPHVVGVRVVVRRVLRGETGPTGGPAMTDVLGVCESWDDALMTVRREDGTLVHVAIGDIVSGKPVPPRPSVHRRLDAAQADRLALPGWLPAESEPLGQWVLRASGGFSSRGNSVLALGDPGMSLDEAVSRVQRWYADRSLVPRAHVHPHGPQDEAFTAAGWSIDRSTLLMLGSVARVLRRLGGNQVVEPQHATRVDAGWLTSDARAERHGQVARAVLEAGEVTFATVRGAHGEVLARGRGTVHGDWAGVSSLWTREDLRNTGLGSAVLESLLTWGAERGATTAYVQVLEDNQQAQAMYAARGFETHHRYAYLVGDTGDQGQQDGR